MEPESFYEIEMKALLSQKEYNRLYNELPNEMKLINEETINTTRYYPGDLRLRHSDKTIEVVCKEGDPTKICRKEVRIPLSSKEKLDHFAQVFELMELKTHPSWVKHKREFEYNFKGHNYIICLQHIENFAYILEVEFLSEKDDSDFHEPNLKAIIEELGCEPIDPEDFSTRISQYIKENKV